MSRWIDRDLIQNPLYYCLCKTPKQFKKELKRLGIKRDIWPPFMIRNAGATTHSFSNNDKLVAIVCMPKFKGKLTRIQVTGLLVHEAMHVWQLIREEIGEEAPSSEFEAYAMQRIVQQLEEAYRS